MTDVAATVDRYLSAYNETDAAARMALLKDAFTADGQLIDPPLDGVGHQGISDMMAAVHQQFAGHTFRRSSGIDEHHGHLRYGWQLLDPTGQVVLAGTDVGQLAPDGRLARITGFFGPLPDVA
ncbi:MAG: nuclear transport factor 2-like protein [Acidimicrobiales bacterium]